jgi:hypothetical protein
MKPGALCVFVQLIGLGNRNQHITGNDPYALLIVVIIFSDTDLIHSLEES